jgi:hypothetical protein
MVDLASIGPEGVTPDLEKTPPSVTDTASYDAISPGMDYLDPKGQKRTKPYRVKDADEYAALPEGVPYLDPEGNARTSPKYEDLDFTTQTLYNMSVTDAERKKALERGYPGKVKTNKQTGEMYVDEDGTLRRSRGYNKSPGSYIASQAAPVIGSIAGEIGGAAGGTLVAPGPGTVGGAIAGGGVGGAAGQAFNDAIMGLAGVYDRTGAEEAGGLALSGLFGAGGTAAGRGLAAAAPAIKGAVANVLPKAAADFLGATPEGVEQASNLREKGTMVPPSAWAKEAPHIINISERFDPAFRTQDPLLQSATEHYEREGKEVLGGLGADKAKIGKLTDPEAAVSTERAGEAVLGRTREELRQADENLRKALEARRADLTGSMQERIAAQESQTRQLETAAAEARKAAQGVIDAGFQEIDKTAQTAMDATKSGHNSGSLWQQVAEKIQKVRSGIMGRANKMYTEADELSGGLKPDISGLSERAGAFLEQMPEGFEKEYPSIVKQLRDMAGVQELDKEGNPTGAWKKEPVQPTWAQLHNLRSAMRSNYNRLNLTPDVKQGTFKFFANRVDEILNDANAVPELQAAAKQLREADNFYRENMGAFNDKRIQAVVDGLDAGLPADPKVLFDTIVKEGRSDLTKKVAEMVGPNLWGGVKAADVRDMLEQSKSVTGEIDGKRFVSQVLERYRSGMLEAVHGKEVSQKLLQQAQNIEALAGRLNIPVRPGDTIGDVINTAKQAADAAKVAAKQDPLGTLTKEMKGIERQLAATKQAARKSLKTNNALDFLYDESVGASEAVDKILGSEDLIIAAASKFGPNSPEFNMLRQTWAQKLLTGTLTPSTKLAKVSEEVQRIMFPGVSLDQMKTLAKEMDFLMGTRGGMASNMAGGLAAMSKVEHPWSSIPLGKAAGKLIPGMDAAGRYMLGKYFKTVTTLVNNPAFLRWIEKGLKGDARAREMVRETVEQRMKIGGAMGAGVGESQYSTPNQNLMLGEQQPNP